MYKLTRCVKTHNVRVPMKRHHAFLMRYGRCHVGVMNSNQRDKYGILHSGIPNYSNKVAFFYFNFICKGYPTYMKGKHLKHRFDLIQFIETNNGIIDLRSFSIDESTLRFDNSQTEGFVVTLCDWFT